MTNSRSHISEIAVALNFQVPAPVSVTLKVKGVKQKIDAAEMQVHAEAFAALCRAVQFGERIYEALLLLHPGQIARYIFVRQASLASKSLAIYPPSIRWEGAQPDALGVSLTEVDAVARNYAADMDDDEFPEVWEWLQWRDNSDVWVFFMRNMQTAAHALVTAIRASTDPIVQYEVQKFDDFRHAFDTRYTNENPLRNEAMLRQCSQVLLEDEDRWLLPALTNLISSNAGRSVSLTGIKSVQVWRGLAALQAKLAAEFNLSKNEALALRVNGKCPRLQLDSWGAAVTYPYSGELRAEVIVRQFDPKMCWYQIPFVEHEGYVVDLFYTPSKHLFINRDLGNFPNAKRTAIGGPWHYYAADDGYAFSKLLVTVSPTNDWVAASRSS